MTPGDIVKLKVNAVGQGDRARPFEAGHQFRLLKVVDELPDAAEVAAEFHFGDRAKRPPRRCKPVGPLAMVRTLDGARLRLLFPAGVLERVPGGETTCDF